MCMCLYTNPLLGIRSHDTQIAMNRTSVQIMASKYHCQKEWELFAEVIDFKTREGEIQNKPGASCVHRK